MKLLATTTLSLALAVGGACAHAEGMQISPAGSTPTQIGDAKTFSGQAAVDLKAAGNSGRYGSVGQVDFMPGARTAWHTYPAGQLLIVTEGRGWVQEQGQPKREIKAGDVVWCDPDVKHWHGAAKDSRMSHYAITYVRDGKAVDWMELVSDEQYNGR